MRAGGVAGRGNWLQNEKLRADEIRVLYGGDDFTDHAGELQALVLDLDRVDNADDRRIDRAVLHPDAMRAELPLTIRTVSPNPASTVSTATR